MGGADEHDAEAGRLIPSVVGTLGGTSPCGGWRFGADEAAAGQLVPMVAGTLGNNGNAAGTETGQDAAAGLLVPEMHLAYGGNYTSGHRDISSCLSSRGG